MNGLYELSMKTPMGVIRGNFYIETIEGNVNGYIEVNGKKSFFHNGKVTGNNKFSLEGTLKAMFKTIKYSVNGELVNDMLVLHTNTNMGNFELHGKKVMK